VRALNSEGLGAAATGSLTPDTSAPSPFPIGTSDTWKIARSYVRPSFVQSLIAGSDGMVEIRIAGSNEFFAVSWKTNLQIGHIFEFTNLAPGVVYEVQVTAVSGASIGRSQGGLSHSFYLEPASATLQEDTSVAINLGTQTAEVLQILTQPSHGTLTPLQDGRWTTYTPAPNFFGTDAFQILDHTSGPPVTVTVTVQNVNDAPVAQPITIYVAEDSQAMFPPVVFDIENDPYVFGVSINAAHGDSYGYQFTHLVYIPYPDFVGQDEFWYYAADESEGPPALVTVIVTNINDQPLVVDQYIEGLEDTATNITLVVTDVDPGDTHTFEIVDAPAFGTLTGTAPNLTYTPNANFGGSDTFTYRVSDGQTNSALGTITLLIFGVNDAPTAQSQSVSTAEDTALPIVLSGSDPDGDFVLYIIDPYPAHGILNLNGAPPDFEYIPDANYHGSDSFTFRTWDGYLQSAPATVSITITPVNDAPVVDSKSVSVNEDGSVAIALTGSDADGDNLTFAVVDPPQHGQFAGGVYTPVANYNGPDSFTYKANDGQLDSAPATVSITINPVNDAPVANAQSVSTAYNTAVNITLNGADIEGSALTFSTLTSPANGTLTGAGANRTFTPDIGWSGTTSFAFKVNDGELDSATATVTITVASPGSIPAAPSGLTATAVSQTQINLAWTDNSSNEDGFKIERSPNGNSSWSQIATVGPNITTYSNTGLNKNTRYHYRVRAYNVLGNSAYSNTANARTLN
jgi:hypothetical protein